MELKEKVARLAYDLYEKNGRHEGRELCDWLAAEQIVRFQKMIISETDAEQVGLLEYKPMSAAESVSILSAASNARQRKSAGGKRKEVAQ